VRAGVEGQRLQIEDRDSVHTGGPAVFGEPGKPDSLAVGRSHRDPDGCTPAEAVRQEFGTASKQLGGGGPSGISSF